jgi:hypothetical protein
MSITKNIIAIFNSTRSVSKYGIFVYTYDRKLVKIDFKLIDKTLTFLKVSHA